MAIFSQKDKKTRVDFRNYNNDLPNRIIPFSLSRDYSDKLRKVAKKLNLFSGSFDILVDKKDNYFFLEINPVGQFGMVSFPCNYYIEREIAKYLIRRSNQK
jgi:glutathione synthase/RimK-type ligase-like ATP-grasp enzyme